MSHIDPFHQLLHMDDAQRDATWEAQFLEAFPNTKLQILAEAPQQGPDGWPYLMTATTDAATEPAGKVLQWLSERGLGLVVNPKTPIPDFVFTYGMVWNYRETGRFFSDMDRQTEIGRTEFTAGAKVLAGPPSEPYLPNYVRTILREFFKQQKREVKILVVSEDQKHFDLCISLESLGNPPRPEHHGILEAVSWFLPAHYSLVLTSESGFPAFHPL